MERSSHKHGLVNLLVLLLVGIAAYATAHHTRTIAGLTSAVFMALGALVAAVSWFQMRLEERERLEKLEFDELAKSASSSALFTASETEAFPARRAREHFERFIVPGFTIALCLAELIGALLIGRSLAKAIQPPHQQPLVCLALFGMFFLILFILGRYSSSLARLERLRLLRPAATCLLFNAYLCLVVFAAVGLTWAGVDKKVDILAAWFLIVLLFLTGLETFVTLILELYRPRVSGKVERPLYESRVLSLLGSPEGLVRTAAQTIDYQFGFKVSETWAFRLFRRWVPWMALGQLTALLLSTTFVFIEAGEHAVLEHYGKFAALLEPGGHLKFPWPVDKVHRFPTDRIQTLDVGFTPDEDEAVSGNAVLWTIPHTKEENFLVANRAIEEVETNATNNASDRRPPPVSLLTVGIPVQFQITDLKAWLYTNEAPEALLQDIANREVVRYLVSADFQDVMSQGRGAAAQTLRDRIQAEANRHQLGVKIVFVGLQDIHPPVPVAPDFEKVVAELQTREVFMIEAESFAFATNTLATAQSNKIVAEARSDRLRQKTESEARAGLFTNQIPAYLASPTVYAERAYLDTFVRAVADARKYIILATNTQDIIILNLEDKLRPDLLENLTLPPVGGTNAGKQP